MFEHILHYLRFTLYGLLLILGFFLFQAWDKEHPTTFTNTPTRTKEAANTTEMPRFVPKSAAEESAPKPEPLSSTALAAKQGSFITVKTDLLSVSINTRGGDINEVKLLKYPESLGAKTPIVLFNDEAKTRYLAESGLLSKQGPDTADAEALYTAEQSTYEIGEHDKQLAVRLHWQSKNGLSIVKTFTFTPGSYEIKVGYQITNQTRTPWEGSLYTQLLRTDNPPANHGGMMSLATYFGAAISTANKPFTKITFKEMREKNLNQTEQDGWAAMIQHYFISAWIPPKNTVSTYYSRVTPSGLYTIGMINKPFTVAPGSTFSTQSQLYVGPAIADLLEKTAAGLKLTIDYGWFWFISGIIFWMMQKIYDVVGNWGVSIILVTVIIKLLFYHLSAKSYRSMSMLKKLQPRIEALKQRYGDDKQKITQGTLDLYRQEKVNPMSGCLPILIQIPVFIALYWVLVESVQLRQAPFIFWIHDLSQQDPYYVLPILMGLSMFLQQRLSPPPPDPLQAKVMMLMPVIFTVLFANFPAGLMLYWFVNNTLSFLQQWHIMHKLDKETNGKKT
jgi:YidC/Oxa1 family membrane protein insertase